MADFKVTVETLSGVHPHPNADRLDVGQIGGYHVVLKKDAFKAGQRVVYIPEASLLPEALIAHLGLTGRLAGAARNRVKAIRLRNVLSEGLVLPLDAEGRVENVETGETADPGHQDLAGFLGIAKWEPPIPTELAGEVMEAPFPLPSYDVEAWKRNPEALPAGTPCVATEKIHGTMVSVTWFPGAEGEEAYPWPAAMPWVASKSYSQKNLAFVPDAGTTYQRVAEGHADGLRRSALEALEAAGTGPPWGISWIGEIAGRGIQDLHYDRANPALVVFDLAFKPDRQARWRYADYDVFCAAADAGGVDRVPEVARLPAPGSGTEDLEAMERLASGPTLWGREKHAREGVVLRSLVEAGSPVDGDRCVRKIVSGAYLTRHKGTEHR